MKNIFNEKMKLADLISANHKLILMLPRFGISLGFGDKSVEEVCETYHIPTDFFLLICNVYTFNDYLPELKEITSTKMDLLVPYLKASHHYYLQEQLPHIERHLHHIADQTEEKYGLLLKKFFTDYQAEVSEHFQYEEESVFPHILALQAKENTPYQIEEFVKTHQNVEDKLEDLTCIIYKYLPGNVLPAESIEIVFDILQLSADFKKHTIIEDKILVPYVQWLEGEKR